MVVQPKIRIPVVCAQDGVAGVFRMIHPGQIVCWRIRCLMMEDSGTEDDHVPFFQPEHLRLNLTNPMQEVLRRQSGKQDEMVHLPVHQHCTRKVSEQNLIDSLQKCTAFPVPQILVDLSVSVDIQIGNAPRLVFHIPPLENLRSVIDIHQVIEQRVTVPLIQRCNIHRSETSGHPAPAGTFRPVQIVVCVPDHGADLPLCPGNSAAVSGAAGNVRFFWLLLTGTAEFQQFIIEEIPVLSIVQNQKLVPAVPVAPVFCGVKYFSHPLSCRPEHQITVCMSVCIVAQFEGVQVDQCDTQQTAGVVRKVVPESCPVQKAGQIICPALPEQLLSLFLCR